MRKKLRSTKAETLIETLISMLIGVLSITLLTTSVMAAARINKATEEADAAYNEELGEAEMRIVKDAENRTIKITFSDGITEQRVTVDIYGTGDFASYEKRGDAS